MARTPSDPVAEPAPEPAADVAKTDTVRLRLHRSFPIDHFEHTVDGKTYSIPATDDGAEVPAEVETALTDAAKDAGLTVKKVSE